MSEIQIIVPIIIALTTSIFGPLLVKWVEKKFINKLNNDPLRDAIQHNEIIEQQLDAILQEVDCDQIYIAQFHNGGHFYPTGKSIAKFSIFYETVSPNAPSIQLELKNIPVALFSKSFNRLLDSDCITIYDFADIDTSTYGLRNFASEYKTKSQYLFAIKNFDGKFIAILGIDYTAKKTKLSDEQVEDILHTSFSLGGVLSNHLKVH